MRSSGSLLRRATPAALLVLLLSAMASGALLAAGDGPGPAKVDINRADARELESLPGVGPHLAGQIIEYREKVGPFERIEDLMNVRGIGEKKFLQLKEHITVGESKRSR